VALAPPRAGQVIDCRYLWWSEHRKGLEEGLKEWPCAVVFAVENKDGKTRLYVLPITHTKPLESENGIELLDQNGSASSGSMTSLRGLSRRRARIGRGSVARRRRPHLDLLAGS
jgi:hypothetical protein